jgi:hypothetical protein
MSSSPSPSSSKAKRQPFTIEEDILLTHFVNSCPLTDWKAISNKMGKRTAKQCRERWNLFLRPDLKKTSFTPEEDRLIIEKQKEYGNSWAFISGFLEGRSATCIKNRWNSTLKKSQVDFFIPLDFIASFDFSFIGEIECL